MRNGENKQPFEPEDPQPSETSSPFASFEAALRDEMETSEAPEAPRRRRRRPGVQVNWRFIFRGFLNILLLAAIGVLAWALLLGPLTPWKDSLVHSVSQLLATPVPPTAAPTFTPAPPKPTRTPRPTFALWTDTPTASPSPLSASETPGPTNTPLVASTGGAPVGAPASSTASSPTPAPTATVSIAGCTPAENITSADVGKKMCVTGRVYKVKQTTSQGLDTFSVLLLNSQGFLFVSYERSWSVKEGACVFATGEIKPLGGSTTILLGFNVPLEFCNP